MIISALFLSGCGDQASSISVSLKGNVSISRIDLQDMALTITNNSSSSWVNVNSAFSGLTQVSLVAGSSTCQNISAVNPLTKGASCTLTYESTTTNDPQNNTGTLNVSWSDNKSNSGSQKLNVTAATYLYAGGNFDTTYNGVSNTLNYIAAWDGTKWNALGPASNPGLDNGINAMVIFNKKLYVGGNFDSVYNGTPNTLDNIAVWDGTSWSATGSSSNPGVNNQVAALAVYNNVLYAGGFFNSTSSGSANSLNGIAALNGDTWTPVGGANPGFDAPVSALGVANNLLYIGGSFDTTYNGTANAYNRIASWNGTSFAALGGSPPGLDNSPLAFTIFNGTLYMGGLFTKSMSGLSNSLNCVAAWNGTAFSARGLPNPGLSGGVRALAVFNNTLYVAGSFATAYNDSGNTLYGIAELSFNTWTAMGSPPGFDNNVDSLVASPSLLYAGGDFDSASSGTANSLNGIGAWDGSNWLPLGSPNPGLNNGVYAIVISPYLNIANAQ